MQKIKYQNKSIVILFGGANREKIIFELIKNGYKIRKIILPFNQSLNLKESINKLKKIKVKFKVVKKNQIQSSLKNFSDCLLLSIGFPHIVSEETFLSHPLAINIHPTLLPKYRGPTTGAYILQNNEKITGSSVHIMSKKADVGDILGQSVVKLNSFDTIKSMQKKVYTSEPTLVLSILKKLKKGIIPIKQNKRYSLTYNKVRKPQDSKIDIKKSMFNLINDIRACDPKKFPAYFIYKNQKVCIKLWRLKKNNEDEL